MNEREFIEKAKRYGYDEDTISQYISAVKEEGITYDDIILTKRFVDKWADVLSESE